MSCWCNGNVFGLISDVHELQGERFGYMLGGPPADSVEEWGQAVPSPQPGPVQKAGGEGRTLTFNPAFKKEEGVGELLLDGVHT